MKTATKVLVILGMISGCWYIIPIIVGAIALSKMGKGKPGIGMGVCEIILGGDIFGIIAGILMLVSKEKDYTSCYLPVDTPAEDKGYKAVERNNRNVYTADGSKVVYSISKHNICAGDTGKRAFWIPRHKDDGLATPIHHGGSNGPVAYMVGKSTIPGYELSVLVYDEHNRKVLGYKYHIAGAIIYSAQDGSPVYQVGPLM